MQDRDRLFWNEAAEMLSAEQIRALQVEKIRRQIAYCYDRSAYYREKFQKIGVKPDDVRTWEDFRRLPVMLTPSEFKAQQEQSLIEEGHPYGRILCADLDQVVGVAATSGTTGRPTLTPFTRQDIATTNEVLARAFWRMGIRPGDTVLNAFGLSMWIMGIPAIRALEAMGTRPIPVGAEGGTERLIMFAQMTRPSALLCTPSYAEYLIERAPESGVHVGDLGIKRIFCAGEPGAGLPAVRRKLQDAWGARVYDFAGGPWGIATISCDHDEYQGMHVICEDYCTHYDLVDPETLAPIDVTNGAVGAAVFTTYEWQAGPPLKYMLNDIVQFTTDPCPCGLPGKRRKIIGRIDDLLIVKGTNVYPAAVRNIVNAFVPKVTGEMRIVLYEPPPRISAPVHIKIEHAAGIGQATLSELDAQITRRIRDVLRFTPRLEFVTPGMLGRSTHKGKFFEKQY